MAYSRTYTLQEKNCSVTYTGTTIKTAGWVTASSNYNVKAYSTIPYIFSANGEKVTITTKVTDCLGQGGLGSGAAATEAVATLYIKNVETGSRTKLGSIYSTSQKTYTFTLPTDSAEYQFEIYTFVDAYGYTTSGGYGAQYFNLAVYDLYISSNE